MSKNALLGCTAAVMVALMPAAGATADDEGIPQLPIIRRGEKTGFANAGWKYDRYKNLQGLDAGKRMVVADIKGPGVITHIHMCRHHPAALCARGIVLEITFDDAKTPAVHAPVADFFGDGCNGGAMDFSSRFIEAAPWSYNCYFPMPFKTRAKVVLRNDTKKNVMDYSYVEWKPLKKWNDKLGYFHATYRRDAFQLTPKTDHMFFQVKGTGHLLGRQYSVITDEPIFRGFAFVMEGNNEVDIDGRERALDYLGTEDSFTFSWGFQRTFAGLRTGMTLVDKAKTNRLSIFRFHDHQPIRFDKELRWHINWSQERMFTRRGQWAKALARGGCWVDYAAVYYWYQAAPGAFKHAPLRGLAERAKPMLRPSIDRIAPADLQSAAAKRLRPSQHVLPQGRSETRGRVGLLPRHAPVLDRSAEGPRRPPGQPQPRATGHPGRPRRRCGRACIRDPKSGPARGQEIQAADRRLRRPVRIPRQERLHPPRGRPGPQGPALDEAPRHRRRQPTLQGQLASPRVSPARPRRQDHRPPHRGPLRRPQGPRHERRGLLRRNHRRNAVASLLIPGCHGPRLRGHAGPRLEVRGER